MNSQLIQLLIPTALFIGIMLGMILISFIPRYPQRTAWFTIDKNIDNTNVENKLVLLFGQRKEFRMDKEFWPNLQDKDGNLNDQVLLVKFELVNLLDFSKTTAQQYLDHSLTILHSHELKEINSGVY